MQPSKSIAILCLTLTGCASLKPVPIPTPDALHNTVVVTDIDGTLTPRNIEVCTARPQAASALKLYAEKGYTVIYVTTRHPLFQSGLPDWLQTQGFPSGPLHVAQTADDRAHPDVFKAAILDAYTAAGWHLSDAYGDSSTDFAAYAAAGMPAEQVFALKRKGDTNCQPGAHQACLEGWDEQLPYIRKLNPPAP